MNKGAIHVSPILFAFVIAASLARDVGASGIYAARIVTSLLGIL